jgi:DNA-binding SARP family transcriptional activator
VATQAGGPGLDEQAIGLEELHEPSWRLALQAEHSLGLRESITRRYDELAHALDEQLGLQPTRETRVMYRQLLGKAEMPLFGAAPNASRKSCMQN